MTSSRKLRVLFLCTGNTKVVHVPFPDPPKLAAEAATEEEALSCYRRVKDDIRAYVETLPEALTGN